MTDSSDHRVLAINTGSSSLKVALYQMSEKETDEELMIARHTLEFLS